MAGRSEGFRLSGFLPDKNVGGGSHAAAYENGLADRPQCRRQAVAAGPEGARRALAMNEKLAALSIDDVRFNLAGVVRNVEQQRKLAARKEMLKDAPR